MREQPSEHEPGAAFIRKHGARLRRAADSRRVRHAWTGVIALAMTGGVLVSASASTATSTSPVLDTAEGTTAAPAREPTDVGQSRPGRTSHETRTGTDAVTVGQVLAVLDRAERTLRQASSPNPRVAQAAAELGMLYTTYEAQQLALAAAAEPLRVETAPVAGRARTIPATEATSAEPVSRVVEKTPQQATVQPARADHAHSRAEPQDPGYVAFDEVAVAAMRLANMLDPSSPTALVETLPDAEPSLRRSLLETVAAYGESTAGYANGRIPAGALCPLQFAPGHLLRCDAAERLTALSVEFEKEFGYPIPLTDSYRSYAMQVAVQGSKPHLAAIPGTSNHGWGLAIDLDDPVAGGSSPEYVWLRLHAPDYGWDNPSWARLGGAKPEPWHFEFFAAGSIPNRAIDPADVGTWAPAEQAAHGDTSRGFRPASGQSPSSTRPTQDSADEHRTGGETGSGSQPADEPAAPVEPEPSRPDPEEPAAEKPSEPEPTDPPTKEPGSGSGAIDDTVKAVDDTVNGIVTGVGDTVGGLLGAGGTTNATSN
ncbi:hypothetical protein GCM10027063_40830 [Promicromonospora xylanilytica]